MKKVTGKAQNGYNADPFTIEKNKIKDYWTDRYGNLHCCYCGHIIHTYDYEHYINKINPNSSNTIENIGIACKDCNKVKGASTDEDFIKTKYLYDKFELDKFTEKSIERYHERIVNWKRKYRQRLNFLYLFLYTK